MYANQSQSSGDGESRAASSAVALFAAFLMMGLILIVGFTVAFFVAESGDDDDRQTDRPSATFAFDPVGGEGADGVIVRHVEGDEIRPHQLYVVLEGATCTDGPDPDGQYNAHEDFGLGPDNWMGPNMAVMIDEDNPTQLCPNGELDLSGATVTVQFDDPSLGMRTIDSGEAS